MRSGASPWVRSDVAADPHGTVAAAPNRTSLAYGDSKQTESESEGRPKCHTLSVDTNRCSMIPPFTTDGLLPPSLDGRGHECSPTDVRQRFVDDLDAPAWRVSLFEGWNEIRAGVSRLVPESRWWLWSCFVSNHPVPLFGEAETLEALVILPVQSVPTSDAELSLLSAALDPGRAQNVLRVVLAVVYEHPPNHPDRIESIEALEYKWRPRAILNVADHNSRDLVPAGFLEVVT